MLDRTGKKLRDRAGESIAEVLIAMLLSTLGILMLGTMIQSATTMISNSSEIYQNYMDAENRLEAQSGEGREAHIKILQDGSMVRLTDESHYDTHVYCYSNLARDGRVVVSYRVSGNAS